MITRYRVIFGLFGSIMPKPIFTDIKVAKYVANVQNGKVVDADSGEVIYDSKTRWDK